MANAFTSQTLQEGGFYRLPVANFPSGAWDAAMTVDEAIATLDQIILLPDLTAADTQDIMAIFQDASVTETSRKLYDNSANSWAEASINNAITELSTATAFANLATAVDLTNSQVILLVWTNTDTLNADLLCYTITNSAITAKTDVVTNSIAIMQSRIARSRLAGEPADVLIAPRFAKVGLLDFHRADEAILAGRKAVEYMLPLLRSLRLPDELRQNVLESTTVEDDGRR
jgi:hypothetical protein